MYIELDKTDLSDYITTNLYSLSCNKSQLKVVKVLNIICKILAVIILLLALVFLGMGKYPVVVLLILLVLPFFFMKKIQVMFLKFSFKKIWEQALPGIRDNKSAISIDEENTNFTGGKVTINLKTNEIFRISDTPEFIFIHLDSLTIVGINKKYISDLPSTQNELRSYASLHNFPYLTDNEWNNNPYTKRKLY